MRRVFQKGLACLHAMFACECAPQPITMHLRTPGKPTGGFVLLCASYITHGPSATRRHFTYINDTLEQKIRRATGLRNDGVASLLTQSTFTILPDGRVADQKDRTIGHIAKF